MGIFFLQDFIISRLSNCIKWRPMKYYSSFFCRCTFETICLSAEFRINVQRSKIEVNFNIVDSFKCLLPVFWNSLSLVLFWWRYKDTFESLKWNVTSVWSSLNKLQHPIMQWPLQLKTCGLLSYLHGHKPPPFLSLYLNLLLLFWYMAGQSWLCKCKHVTYPLQCYIAI